MIFHLLSKTYITNKILIGARSHYFRSTSFCLTRTHTTTHPTKCCALVRINTKYIVQLVCNWTFSRSRTPHLSMVTNLNTRGKTWRPNVMNFLFSLLNINNTYTAIRIINTVIQWKCQQLCLVVCKVVLIGNDLERIRWKSNVGV